MYDCRVKSAERIWRITIILWFLALFAGCTSIFPRNSVGENTENPDQQRTIIEIKAVSAADADRISIQATDRLDYSSVKQKSPLSILFYFPETLLGDIQREMAIDSAAITLIKATATEDNKNVRVEIDLNHDVAYDVEKTDTSLLITINKPAVQDLVTSSGTLSSPPVKPASLTTRPAGAPVLPAVESKFSNDIVSEDTKSPSVIRQIDFSAEKSGGSTIIIGTSHPVRHELNKMATRRLHLRLYNTRLPQFREHRPLITTRFDSAVDRVTPVQAPAISNTVDIIIELREEVPYRTEKNEGQLVLHFDPSSIGPRPLSAANLPDWKQVLEESIVETASAGMVSARDASAKVAYESYFGESKAYNGQKIALDFYETNIKNVFRILQQISGKNYAIDPNVNGKVTICMEKPVPCDQVLDLILKMNNLGMEEKGDIVRIASLQTLNQEEQLRQQQVQALQKRQEQEKALEPLVTEYISVNYANAEKEILPHLSEILTKERGKVSVDQRNNQVIITDVRPQIDKAREIIAQIDKVTPQVVIEARIVEVSDDFSREIGTDWAVASDDVFRDDLDGFYSYDVAMNHPAASTSSLGFDFVRLPSMGTPLVLNARLTAMEQNGEGKIISSPKIVTVDNKKAKITQGFEYPYQTVEDNDVNIEFKDIDLTLEVTPHVTPDRRIALEIFVTKNDIDRILPGGEPSLSTNEAQTQLLVDDGNTIVIGGIMKTTINVSETGFPILKDIPLVGWLFKAQSNTNEKNELLIFITPTIVQLEQRGFASTDDQFIRH